MNTMQVEVLTREGGHYLAVACPDNGLISEAGIGGGESERAAILQAINSYFNRFEQREQANTTPALAAIRSATVAVSPTEIRRLLEEAVRTSAHVLITGKKVSGDRYTDREVVPFSLQDGPKWGAYLHCNTDQGTRSFRLDGIERVEVLYPDTSA